MDYRAGSDDVASDVLSGDCLVGLRNMFCSEAKGTLCHSDGMRHTARRNRDCLRRRCVRTVGVVCGYGSSAMLLRVLLSQTGVLFTTDLGDPEVVSCSPTLNIVSSFAPAKMRISMPPPCAVSLCSPVAYVYSEIIAILPSLPRSQV